MTEMEFRLNVAYMIITLLSLLLLKYCHGNPKRRYILVFNLYVLQFRLVFRFLDFEGTRHLKAEGDWMWLIIMNMYGWSHTFEYITSIQDQNVWFQISRFVSILFGMVVASHSCFGKRDNDPFPIIKSGVFGTVIAMALLF